MMLISVNQKALEAKPIVGGLFDGEDLGSTQAVDVEYLDEEGCLRSERYYFAQESDKKWFINEIKKKIK